HREVATAVFRPCSIGRLDNGPAFPPFVDIFRASCNAALTVNTRSDDTSLGSTRCVHGADSGAAEHWSRVRTDEYAILAIRATQHLCIARLDGRFPFLIGSVNEWRGRADDAWGAFECGGFSSEGHRAHSGKDECSDCRDEVPLLQAKVHIEPQPSGH